MFTVVLSSFFALFYFHHWCFCFTEITWFFIDIDKISTCIFVQKSCWFMFLIFQVKYQLNECKEVWKINMNFFYHNHRFAIGSHVLIKQGSSLLPAVVSLNMCWFNVQFCVCGFWPLAESFNKNSNMLQVAPLFDVVLGLVYPWSVLYDWVKGVKLIHTYIVMFLSQCFVYTQCLHSWV